MRDESTGLTGTTGLKIKQAKMKYQSITWKYLRYMQHMKC